MRAGGFEPAQALQPPRAPDAHVGRLQAAAAGVLRRGRSHQYVAVTAGRVEGVDPPARVGRKGGDP